MRVEDLPDTIDGINTAMRRERLRRAWRRFAAFMDGLVTLSYWPVGVQENSRWGAVQARRNEVEHQQAERERSQRAANRLDAAPGSAEPGPDPAA